MRWLRAWRGSDDKFPMSTCAPRTVGDRARLARVRVDDGYKVTDGVVFAVARRGFDGAVELGDAGFHCRPIVEAPVQVGAVSSVASGVVGGHHTEAFDTGIGEGIL